MSTFGSLLVQDQIVGVSEIEQALQHQVIYGGDLATNLLELGLAGENVLTEYMARSMNMPPVNIDLIRDVDLEAIKKVPWTVASNNELVPIRFIGDRMQIAVSTPLNGEACRELAFLLGFDFTQSFTLGFRLAMARNRLYGIPIPPRYSSLQKRLVPEFELDLPSLIPPPSVMDGLLSPADSEVDEEPGSVAEETPEFHREDTDSGYVVASKKTEAEIDSTVKIFVPTKTSKKATDVKFLEVPEDFKREVDSVLESDPIPQIARQEPEASEEQAKPAESQKQLQALFTPDGVSQGPQSERFAPEFNLSEAMAQMREAKDRDTVIDLVMKHGSRAFEFVVLMVVHGKTAQGRAAVHNKVRSDKVDYLSVPLDQGGMFQNVFDTRSCHLGPLGTSEIEQQVLKSLGRPWPKNCVIMPVTLRNRVVSIIYGDSGAAGVDAHLITDFTSFTKSVADAFERILLARKTGNQKRVPSKVPSRPPKMGSWIPDAPGAKSAGRYHVTSEETTDSKNPMADVVAGASSSRPSRPAPPQKHESKPEKSHREVIEVRPSSPPPKSEKDTIDYRPSSRPPRPPISKPPSRPPETPSRSPGAYSSAGYADSEDISESTTAAVLEHIRDHHDDPVPMRSVINVVNKNKDSITPEVVKPHVGDGEEKDDPEQQSTPYDPSVTTSKVVSVGQASRSRSVVVEMNEEINRLIERILAPGRFDETAADLLLGIGDDALAKLISKFPGPLLCDRYQQVGRLQRVGRHGPLLQTLIKFRKKAVPYLTGLFESPDSDVRFYAIFMFSELIYPDAVPALKSRLFDNDRQIRALTVDVIRAYKKYPEYRWAMDEVSDVLGSPQSGFDAKIIAAEALGQLKVPSAMDTLILMLESVDTNLVERCHRALVRISFEDFGFSGPKWNAWFEKNRMRNRAEWAIDSIVHRKEAIRNAAISEIPQIVGDVVDWASGPLDHKKRVELQQTLRDWWIREGRALFPSQGSE